MNAFNNINLAASCIITSTKYAKELGIPESKWIYPLGGAGTQDSDKCRYSNDTRGQNNANARRLSVWERPNYHSSPSISRSLDACLDVCGLHKDQIDLFDFYSCVTLAYCSHVSLRLIFVTAASLSCPS